ncbi:hypothetical protein ACG3SL_03645 [Sphingomonas sp. CJ20]
MRFRGFITPSDRPEDFEAVAADVGTKIGSGYRSLSDMGGMLGENRIFDAIVGKLEALDLNYEDQCSARYYFDLVRSLRDFNGQFDRVVEVGVFMGGSSSYLAGCMGPFDFDLDMVDVNEPYLRFAYERVRRMYPEAAKRIRLFHGDLPSYVRQVMLPERGRTSIIHHDGSHEFGQVVKDMASLYYVREKILAVIAQDTHLRGPVHRMDFVDLALYAVFGTDLKFAPIGSVYHDHRMTTPNAFGGGYFMAGVAEGVVLPMAANQFVYPHPMLNIDDFLPAAPQPEATLSAAA